MTDKQVTVTADRPSGSRPPVCPTGILVCGLNGAGKSTLAKALAEALQFYCIDAEDLFFEGSGPDRDYTAPRSRAAAQALLRQWVQTHDHFVLAAVRADWAPEMLPLIACAVLIKAPRALRLRRLRRRVRRQPGGWAPPGTAAHRQRTAFLKMAAARPEDYVEAWAATLHCPVLCVDGAAPLQQSVQQVLSQWRTLQKEREDDTATTAGGV